MYYENKRTFYIKQYGLPVALILVAVILIGTGIFFGIKSNSNDIVASNPPVESNSSILTADSFTGKVTNVNGLTITVTSNGVSQDINLIGVKEHKYNPNLSQEIAHDLIDKDVTVDFDTQKFERGKTYAYVYVNNNLYNAKLLSNGSAELRPERANINKLDVLLEAQLNAKHNGLGIWSY